MKRRQVLKNITYSIGGIISMPLWASCWNKESLPVQYSQLSAEQEKLLSEIVETIIPTTDSPGAKEIGVHQFVKAMVYDCYDEEDQRDLVDLLYKIDEKSVSESRKSFIENSLEVRTNILLEVEKNLKSSPEGNFKAYPFLKELTIQGYLNSEYVMTHIHKYELVPGRFNGSFPVQKA